MASSVMMFNSPGTVWTATGAQFMAAARQHWSDALIANDPYAGGYHLVGVQFIVPGGMGVDAQFAVRGDGDGYFLDPVGNPSGGGGDVRLGPRLVGPRERMLHCGDRNRHHHSRALWHQPRRSPRHHCDREPLNPLSSRRSRGWCLGAGPLSVLAGPFSGENRLGGQQGLHRGNPILGTRVSPRDVLRCQGIPR
jgi:hypothetical protein